MEFSKFQGVIKEMKNVFWGETVIFCSISPEIFSQGTWPSLEDSLIYIVSLIWYTPINFLIMIHLFLVNAGHNQELLGKGSRMQSFSSMWFWNCMKTTGRNDQPNDYPVVLKLCSDFILQMSHDSHCSAAFLFIQAKCLSALIVSANFSLQVLNDMNQPILISLF